MFEISLMELCHACSFLFLFTNTHANAFLFLWLYLHVNMDICAWLQTFAVYAQVDNLLLKKIKKKKKRRFWFSSHSKLHVDQTKITVAGNISIPDTVLMLFVDLYSSSVNFAAFNLEFLQTLLLCALPLPPFSYWWYARGTFIFFSCGDEDNGCRNW